MIKTDAQTLVWLLNRPLNDLPNAVMTGWLAYIWLFDFHVKHIPGDKKGATDALSRSGAGPADAPEDEDEADDYFDAKLSSIQGSYRAAHYSTARIYLDEADYEGDDLILRGYSETLRRPGGLNYQEF